MIKEFREFAMRGNVVDLAVGIILGTAFGAIVNSLVKDIIMPPIGLILGGADFSDLFFSLSGQEYESLAAAQEAGAATINYGVFINVLINFIVVALAMFLLVRAINRLSRKQEQGEEAPPAEPAPDPAVEMQQKLNDTLERLAKALEEKN